MYYCKSRYYVPEWCRWLNADSPSFLEPTIPNQMNLFVYCSNNPIAIIDSNGKVGFLATLLIGALVGAVVNLATELIEDVSTDGKIGGDKDGMDYLGAAVGGAISGTGSGFIGGTFTGFAGDIFDGLISGDLSLDNFVEYAKNSLANNAINSGALAVTKVGIAFGGGATFSILKKTKKVSHSKINKVLRPLTDDLNIGSKKATIYNISKKIYKNQIFKTFYDWFELGTNSIIELVKSF